MSPALDSRSMGGSSDSWGWAGKRVDLSKVHLSLCVTAGTSPSPLDRAGDVYTCFPFVHFRKFHMLCKSTSSVSSCSIHILLISPGLVLFCEVVLPLLA